MTRRTTLLLLLLGLVLVVTGVVTWRCQADDRYVAPTPGPSGATAAPDLATSSLAELQRAVSRGDGAAAGAQGATPATAELLTAVSANAAALRLADVTFRYVSETGGVDADGGWRASVETTWRVAGFDRTAARTEVEFGFAADGRIAAVGGGSDPTPVWLSGPLAVRRTGATVVAVAGAQDAAGYDRSARHAAAVVRRALGHRTRLVVEVPASAAALDAALGEPEGSYAGIAAVSVAPDATRATDSPVHVFVNPEVWAGLDKVEAEVVMAHEAVHVATGAPRASAPLWLLEGFADYVALRDVDLPLTTTAGQITRQVRRDGVPGALPADTDFNARASHLGASYEAAWLACVTLAEHGSERQLVALYDAVLGGAEVSEELRSRFGWTVADLTAAWQTRLADLAGVPQ